MPELTKSEERALMVETVLKKEQYMVKIPFDFKWGEVDAAVREQGFVEVDTSQKFQEVMGFGGAFTESSAFNWAMLPKKIQEKVLEAYFGEDGIGYSVGRVHINSCDFSMASYNFDDVEDDFELEHFDSNVTHDAALLIPFIKAANAKNKYGPMKIFASPWSPPEWMKVPVDKNDKMTMKGSAWPVGLKNDPRYHRSWALYFSKWLTAYKNHGIDIWGVTIQNEPLFAAPWDACVWTPEYMRDFARDFLGPMLKENHPEVKIMGFDHNKDLVVEWAEILYADPEARAVFDGMAFHWYGGGVDRLIDGTYGYAMLQRLHNLAPDKFILPSEGCSCPGVKYGSILRAERKAHDIMQDLNNWSVGWVDWNLLLNFEGGPNHVGNICDAPILTREDFSDVVFQPEYFYTGHITRYVQPGAVNIYSSPTARYQKYKGGRANIIENLEGTLWSCDGSSRQEWTLKDNKVWLQDVIHEEWKFCLGTGDFEKQDQVFLKVCDSKDAGLFDLDDAGRLVLQADAPGNLYNQTMCLTVMDNSHRDAAMAVFEFCPDEVAPEDVPPQRKWDFQSVVDKEKGGITGEIVNGKHGKCLTAGWAFFQSSAFLNPDGSTVLVVLNEADEGVEFNIISDGDYVPTSIGPHSMQTYVY